MTINNVCVCVCEQCDIFVLCKSPQAGRFSLFVRRSVVAATEFATGMRHHVVSRVVYDARDIPDTIYFQALDSVYASSCRDCL